MRADKACPWPGLKPVATETLFEQMTSKQRQILSFASFKWQARGGGWNQWPLKPSLSRWHLSRGKSCHWPLSNNKQETAKEIWGHRNPVQSKRKSSGPNVCREGGRQCGQTADPQHSPGSLGPCHSPGRAHWYSSRTKHNTPLELSSWGEKKKKHWEIAHSVVPPPKAVAIKRMVLICRLLKITKLYCLWSENHAEF